MVWWVPVYLLPSFNRYHILSKLVRLNPFPNFLLEYSKLNLKYYAIPILYKIDNSSLVISSHILVVWIVFFTVDMFKLESK